MPCNHPGFVECNDCPGPEPDARPAPAGTFKVDCAVCLGAGQIQCVKWSDNYAASVAEKLKAAFDVGMSHRSRVQSNGPHLPPVKDHFDLTITEPGFMDSQVFSTEDAMLKGLEAIGQSAASTRKRLLEKCEPGWFEPEAYRGMWNPRPVSAMKGAIIVPICYHQGVLFEYLQYSHEGKPAYRIAWTFQGQYKMIGLAAAAKL